MYQKGDEQRLRQNQEDSAPFLRHLCVFRRISGKPSMKAADGFVFIDSMYVSVTNYDDGLSAFGLIAFPPASDSFREHSI